MRKKRSMIKRAALALIGGAMALSLSARRAQAEDLRYNNDSDRARFWSIGPRATYFKAKDADKGKWYGGAQIREYWGTAIGFEQSIDYHRNNLGNGFRVDQYPVQASIMAFVFPNPTLNPYILGGVGYYFTHLKTPADNLTKNKFGFHAGAGLQLRLNDFWSLDGDYRYVWIEKIKSDAALINKDFNLSGSMVTIGLNYHF